MKNADIIARYLPNRSFEESRNALIVPVEAGEVANTVRALKDASLPLITMYATDERAKSNVFRIHYVFGVPKETVRIVVRLSVQNPVFPSLAREFPGLALYEREIQTMFGLKPEGHPDPRSLILHEENWPSNTFPLRKDFAWDTRVPETKSGTYTFNVVGGEGIYEIPVGPVHAGIIEPGHFRFSMMGEKILTLEARLGWVHKGVEKLFENLPLEKKVLLSERISGDSSFSHSLAFCEALEMLTETKVPARGEYLRLIYAELERLTMHLFDIGNIGGNGTGFGFMAAQGFRMVEQMRQMNETISGSRFLRGVNVPGGVTKDISSETKTALLAFLSALKKDFAEIMRIADGSASFENRIKGTGILSPSIATEYEAVGIGARACGIAKDARVQYPYGAYKDIKPEIILEKSGDVAARFHVRVREMMETVTLIEKALASMPSGAVRAELRSLPENSMAISAVEGWRGEIVYAIHTENGVISRVKVRDPSFINWQLFGHMIDADMVPDFPLINKSLNLSYTGNDL